MQSTDDGALLRQYVEEKSDEAFATLVRRHINLVYSIALRHIGDPHHAEEITQVVFIILARKAAQLRHDKALSSWLFHATHLTANNFLRSEMRRRVREREACMRTILNESASNDTWDRIAPLLDRAVAGLNEKDRQAVVLRFYEGKNLREVSLALGASEEAARKRVNRAVDKLQKFFLKRGVASTTAAIMGAISANSVQAAPASLANSVAAVAASKGAAASASTATFLKGTLKVMAWTKAKTAIVFGMAGILAAGTTATLVVERHHHRSQPQQDFPRSLWGNAGYADPVSAFETGLWAAMKGDGKMLLASCSPRMHNDAVIKAGGQMQAQGKSLSEEELFTLIGSRYVDGVVGFHILDERFVSGDQVVMHVQLQGREQAQTIQMKKLDGQWKIDDIQ